MPDNIYTTRQLGKVLEALDRPSSFLLDMFFPDLQLFETEKIDFDLIDRQKTLAPFVSPVMASKPQKDRGFETKSFEPAYVKPKTPIKQNRPMKRRPGERVGGEMRPGERYQAVVASLMSDHRDQIIRRKELMAAQALQTGKVIVEGEDYPRKEVDFKRDVSLTKALIGGARWGQAGVKPMKCLEDWAGEIQNKSGAVSTTVVMDPLAWNLFRQDDDLLRLLDTRRQASGEVELGPIAVGGEDNPALYAGSIGAFHFWIYNDTYVDENGVDQKFLADYQVIMGGTKIEGVQAHGAIQDSKLGYHALEFAPVIIAEGDPPIDQVMTQSAPLVVLTRANASLAATVSGPA